MIVINPEAAQQFSLALYELATNSQKYGLTAADSARVEVSWGTSDGRLELLWREYGIPKVQSDDQLRPEGFGTKLLTRVIPAMLKGEASRKFEDGGLVYRLSVPLEAVVARQGHGDSDRMAARIVDETFGMETD